jgi:hypothetical protein
VIARLRKYVPWGRPPKVWAPIYCKPVTIGNCEYLVIFTRGFIGGAYFKGLNEILMA